MTRTATAQRFTFHQPPAELDTEPGLRQVRDEGTPIGYINPIRDGYAIRDLDGRKLDSTYGISRRTSAGVLAQHPAVLARRMSTAVLLRTAYALTHSIDAAQQAEAQAYYTADLDAARTLIADLRTQRDLIDAEVIRRAGE